MGVQQALLSWGVKRTHIEQVQHRHCQLDKVCLSPLLYTFAAPVSQALQLSHMKHLNDDSLAALVTAARHIRVLGLQEPGR